MIIGLKSLSYRHKTFSKSNENIHKMQNSWTIIFANDYYAITVVLRNRFDMYIFRMHIAM